MEQKSFNQKPVFDTNAKLIHKERLAVNPDADDYSYLKAMVGDRLSDRLFDVTKQFDVALDLGCGSGHLSKNITDATVQHKLFMAESSPGLLEIATTPSCDSIQVEKVLVDLEQPLPFPDKHFDLVISSLSLHWVNNLPAIMREIHRCLAPNGVFIASMFGGDTLFELRSSLLLAEMERTGGVCSHISPFTSPENLAGLLTDAGFILPTLDSEDIVVGYPSIFELMFDLKGMGEANANINRPQNLRKDVMMAAAAIYQELYGSEEGIPATFQILYIIGWRPDPSRKVEVSPRGSAEFSLKEINRLEELIKEKGIEGRRQFMDEISNKPSKESDDKS